jgi:hypothetical protein
MSRHPHLGVSGAKPRLPKAEPNGEPASKEEIARLSAEYLRTRNEQMRAKALSAQMKLAKERGELISKELVSRQAAFIFTSLRQSVLNFPSTYARQMVGLTDPRQAKEALTKTAHEFLTELSNFPEKCIDPGWLETLEGDQDHGERLRPADGPTIRVEEQKAKRRRAKKTQTMRKLRERART